MSADAPPAADATQIAVLQAIRENTAALLRISENIDFLSRTIAVPHTLDARDQAHVVRPSVVSDDDATIRPWKQTCLVSENRLEWHTHAAANTAVRKPFHSDGGRVPATCITPDLRPSSELSAVLDKLQAALAKTSDEDEKQALVDKFATRAWNADLIPSVRDFVRDPDSNDILVRDGSVEWAEIRRTLAQWDTLPHREGDLPAFRIFGKRDEWLFDGRRHRADDRPAVVHILRPELCEWWRHGVRYEPRPEVRARAVEQIRAARGDLIREHIAAQRAPLTWDARFVPK
jgi:hypothetical protein